MSSIALDRTEQSAASNADVSSPPRCDFTAARRLAFP